MAARSPLTVRFKENDYAGEYEIDGGVLQVFFKDQSKATKVNSSNPDLLARLLLIELVYRVPSWRE